MYSYEVKIDGPYEFNRVLDRLSMDPLHAVDKEARIIRVPMYDRGEPVVVTVKAVGTSEHPAFEVSSEKEMSSTIKERIARIFHWDRSLTPVQQHYLQTNLAPIFKEHEGTPIVLEFNMYGCMMKCIIHQQLNLKFAHTLTERFVQQFGFQRDGVWFYPLPETIAELDYEALTSLQFSRRKAEYVIDTSRLIAEGKLNVENIDHQTDEEILKELIKVRGIGPWTVQNVLLFALGRPNLFPIADIGIQNALKKLFNLPAKPSKDEMEKWSKDWEPYLSYASLYLWRSIE
ncbi:DNA-3-methyladenine glycosylase family protein [Sutcliffiella sp. NC1]|uniref:DNA-3-methyladenine glycosylase family protein n=1 Tax=Sutcliffiella sp. NC1 TaxID=3004096 RepID=UPI0022DE4CDF|nr:DNA-3-methyladenine glycosylase [Sutcliffiella sp. NC1]WBL15662.1 DNA-3-methyladenine glycosylase [Sutcliffiella sp. NC1]